MAEKYDFDVVIAGDGPEPRLLGHLLASRRLDVLLIPPRERISDSRDSLFLDPHWEGRLGEEGLEVPREEGRILEWVFHPGDRKDSGKNSQGYMGFSADRISDYWNARENISPKMSAQPDLDVKTLRQDPTGVVLEGLSPSWDFRYRCRYLIVFPRHPVICGLAEVTFKESVPPFWLVGDFEDASGWGQGYRAFPSPRGLTESFTLPRNTRRYALPVNLPLEPYGSDHLRQSLPGITGVDLGDRRQSWEAVKSNPEGKSWIIRKDRIIGMDTGAGAYPGFPGNLSLWPALWTLAEAFSTGRKAWTKFPGFLDRWNLREDDRARKIYKVWKKSQGIAKPKGALWGPFRTRQWEECCHGMTKILREREDVR